MKLLIGITLVTVAVATYVVWVRPWLRIQPWAQPFFDAIEPIERVLWKNSESILWARFLQGLGALLTFLVQIGSIDLTPLAPLLPEGLQWLPGVLPLLVTFAGYVQEKLRKGTTKPLEIVAMRTDAPLEVKLDAAKADVATAKAVASVEAAKAA